MDNHLVISALGKDRPGIVNELSKAILECGCNIADSRMAVLGGEFALILMVAGDKQSVTNLEKLLPGVGSQLGLTIIAKSTEPRPPRGQTLPYAVNVVAMDHPGIVHDIAQFFSSRDINIEKLDTETYAAAHTGAPMFSLRMTISVPGDAQIGRLREAFVKFCDDLNLDAALETEKRQA